MDRNHGHGVRRWRALIVVAALVGSMIGGVGPAAADEVVAGISWTSIEAVDLPELAARGISWTAARGISWTSAQGISWTAGISWTSLARGISWTQGISWTAGISWTSLARGISWTARGISWT